MKKILTIILILFFSQIISLSVLAGSDGKIELTEKKNSKQESIEVRIALKQLIEVFLHLIRV